MTLLITLTTAGADSGPFNLYSDVDNYTTAFETNVLKSALVAGYTSSLAPVGTTIVRIESEGTCTNHIDRYVNGSITTTTTTTASLPPVACGVQSTYSGVEGYPITQSVTLGSGTGLVNYTFQAYGVPDRFIVKWDNGVVIDTGYRGLSSYDIGGSDRSSFNASLTGKLDPIALVTYPNITIYPSDGYPRVTSPGNGTVSFNKNLANPTSALVEVYAPMSGTAWDFQMNCPITTTTTSTTVTPTTTSTSSTSTTTTTTSTTAAPTTTTTTSTAVPGTYTSINMNSLQSEIVADTSGNVYVACLTANNVKKVTPAGVVTTFGSTSIAPWAVRIDSSGNVFALTQDGSGTIIVNKITPAGVSTVFANIATGTSRDLAIDSSNNLYLTRSFPSGNGDVVKITPAGSFSTFATTGSLPQGMAFDSLGNLYVANQAQDNVLKITPSGTTTVFGITGDAPYQIVIDSSDTLYITNYSSTGGVTKITSSGTSTIVGTTPPNPRGVAVDSVGNIYTANITANSITKITPSGASSTFVSFGNAAFYDIIIVGGYMYATSYGTFNLTKIAV
jgi:streptogramin lyase